MRFFASWWERVPTRQVGKAVGVVALVAVLGFGFSFSTSAAQTWFTNLPRPIGEYWG